MNDRIIHLYLKIVVKSDARDGFLLWENWPLTDLIRSITSWIRLYISLVSSSGLIDLWFFSDWRKISSMILNRKNLNISHKNSWNKDASCWFRGPSTRNRLFPKRAAKLAKLLIENFLLDRRSQNIFRKRLCPS